MSQIQIINIEADVAQIAADAWDAAKSDYQRQVEQLTGQDATPAAVDRYVIYSDCGLPIACRLCGQIDQWTLEGEAVPVFVCEHEPIEAGHLGIRQLDSVPKSRVYRFILATEE